MCACLSIVQTVILTLAVDFFKTIFHSFEAGIARAIPAANEEK